MKSDIVIRNAQKEDVREIAEICVEDWKKAYRGIIDDDFLDSKSVDRQFDIEIKRYQENIVATDGNGILGYAWLKAIEDEAADCEVIALYVKYASRNNGIGKRLLQYAIHSFREIGKSRMIIWCLKENREARKFYEKAGGKEFRISTHNWGGKDYELISYLFDLKEDPSPVE